MKLELRDLSCGYERKKAHYKKREYRAFFRRCLLYTRAQWRG